MFLRQQDCLGYTSFFVILNLFIASRGVILFTLAEGTTPVRHIIFPDRSDYQDLYLNDSAWILKQIQDDTLNVKLLFAEDSGFRHKFVEHPWKNCGQACSKFVDSCRAAKFTTHGTSFAQGFARAMHRVVHKCYAIIAAVIRAVLHLIHKPNNKRGFRNFILYNYEGSV
jgi:hypothetical protein